MHQLSIDLVEAIHEHEHYTQMTTDAQVSSHADVGIKECEENVNSDNMINTQLRLAVLEQFFKEAFVLDLLGQSQRCWGASHYRAPAVQRFPPEVSPSVRGPRHAQRAPRAQRKLQPFSLAAPEEALAALESEAAQRRAAQSSAAQSSAAQSRAEQSRAAQSRAEQSSAEQRSAEQSRAEQRNAEQRSAEQRSAEQRRAAQSSAEQRRAAQSSAEQRSAAQSSAEQRRAARTQRSPLQPQ
jgi:hypothetical protein